MSKTVTLEISDSCSLDLLFYSPATWTGDEGVFRSTMIHCLINVIKREPDDGVLVPMPVLSHELVRARGSDRLEQAVKQKVKHLINRYARSDVDPIRIPKEYEFLLDKWIHASCQLQLGLYQSDMEMIARSRSGAQAS